MKLFRLIIVVSCMVLMSYAVKDLIESKKSASTPSEYPAEVGAYAQFFMGIGSNLSIYVGGGICVQQEEEFCYVLTAAHVCEAYPGMMMMDIEGDIFPYTVSTRETYLDLCLVEAYHQFENEINRFAIDVPHYAEAYNYSAPQGFFRPGRNYLLPLLTGYFSGNAPEREMGVFTIPVDQGSSGSAAMMEGRIVGVIVEKSLVFSHVGIATNSFLTAAFVWANGLDITVERYDPVSGWIDLHIEEDIDTGDILMIE